MVTSLTPEDQRERAHAIPAGPAPTTRTFVLDGRDIVSSCWLIGLIDGEWTRALG